MLWKSSAAALLLLLQSSTSVQAAVECAFVKDTLLLQDRLTLLQYVNPETATVTFQLVYQGIGWMGVGFGKTMVGSQAVIGLPDTQEVGFYNLGGFSDAQVTPIQDGIELTDATIEQTDSETTLTFTRPTMDLGETIVTADGTTATDIIFAVGAANGPLAYHGFTNRGTAAIVFDACQEVGAADPVLAPVPAPPVPAPPAPAPGGLQNGDEICVEGYIMDRFCVNRMTLFDNPSVETLRNPELHSVHCLVDVQPCVDSGYVVLNDKVDGNDLHTVGYGLDTAGSATLRALAQQEGLANPGNGVPACTTCTPGGSVATGFRAGMVATVVDASADPPLIQVTTANAVTVNDVFCSPVIDIPAPDPVMPDPVPVPETPAPVAVPATPEPTASPTVTPPLQNGDSVCAEGFIMDRFCLNRGTLLDNSSVETLRNPEKHSVHCLVDISVCHESGYVVLNDKVDGAELHTVGFGVDEAGSATLRQLAQEAGIPSPGGGIARCTTCTEGGTVAAGFRAGIVGTVVDASTDPPMIRVDSAQAVTVDEVFCQADGGGVVPQDLDCSFQGEVELQSGLIMRQVINQNEDTITIQMVYDGESWLGSGFSSTGAMVPGRAVIGFPDGEESGVALYNLGGRAPDLVTPLADQSGLSDASLEQVDGQTILTYTIPATQSDGSRLATAGESSRIIYAIGIGNAKGFHQARAAKDVTFSNCIAVGAPPPPPTPPVPPTPSPTETPIVAGSDGTIALSDDLAVRLVADEEVGTVDVELTYENNVGWVGFGTSPDGSMVGSQVVIGLPGGDPEVAKYTLTARSNAGIELMPPEQQTLIEGSVVQNDTHTVLRYVKLLDEPDELPISATEQNTFVYATGPSNTLGFHNQRDSITAAIGGEVGERGGGPANRGVWMAHGILMGISWGILVPLAIGCSLLRDLLPFPPGMWFTCHFYLNSLAVLSTVIGFALAVWAVNDETGGGSAANHFQGVTHTKVGLSVFLMAVVQAGVALFRPHPPSAPDQEEDDNEEVDAEAGEENNGTDDMKGHDSMAKSTVRFLWECKHKLFGCALLGLTWYNVDSGIGLFALRFSEDDITNVFWGITGSLAGLIAVGTIVSKLKK